MLIEAMEVIPLSDASEFLPVIANWHHAEWGHLHPGRTVGDLIAEMSEYLGNADVPVMYVAVDNGQPLATSSLIAHDMDNHPELTPWLANVYVHPGYRGQGLGKRMIDAVMEQARRLGLKRLYLFTTDQENYYRRQGWCSYGREDYKGDVVTIMFYDL